MRMRIDTFVSSARRIAVVAVILCVGVSARAGNPVLVDPNVPNGERSVYRLEKADGSISQSIHRISVSQQDGAPVYVIETESKTMVLNKRNLTPIRIEQRLPTGAVDWSIQYSKDRVNFIYPGPTRNKVEQVDENRYDVNPIIHVIRGFPFGKEDKVKLDLVTPDMIVGIFFEVEGEERITCPVGTFNCYRLKAGLTGIKGRVFKKRIVFWVEKAAAHRLIRQEDEGISDTRVTELVEWSVSPGATK